MIILCPRRAGPGLRDAQIDGGTSCPALGFVALGAEEGECEVDALDLTKPVLFLGPP